MKQLIRPALYLFTAIVIFTGCRKETEATEQNTGAELFVSANSSGSFTKATLQTFANNAGLGTYSALIKYDVEFFKFIYKTTFKGNKVDVSGLLAVPKNVPFVPSILSAQHGTIFKNTDAPSNFPVSFTGFELFAAGGFVTIIPDFIGYGVSQTIPHPYYDQESSGRVVVDMLKAVKYYLTKQKIAVSNRLFLVGYSEGGYVTMAAQKEIETKAANDLTVTAAAAGAGGYDLTGMLTAIAGTQTYKSPSFLALLIRGYNSTYDWKRPYSDFFKQPYADKIQSLLDGSKSGGEIDAQLSSSPANLFNPTFYNSLISATGEAAFNEKLTANSFISWVPKSPTRLYHGTADEAVFYQTSVSTIHRFKASGATNVELITIPNGTHETSVEPMIVNALPWIQSLDK